jgi:hypothetical protein
MMSVRKRSCCSSSSARRVGPGWLHSGISKHVRQGGENLLEKFRILGLAEVLQVAEIGHELGLVKVLLLGQVIEIDGIREALHKLGHC